jgi:beta-galactosidase
LSAIGVFSTTELLGSDSPTPSSAQGPSTEGVTPFPDPVFPFGAVYFRKSSPPTEDWARDHQVAAQLGMNVFRHWCIWGAIETSPGHYDWRDYDRMVELEGQNHIKVILAELVGTAPEWMWDKYPHARTVGATGEESYPGSATGSATGSASMCLDDDDVLAGAGKFLTALASRYHTHPAVMGYDLWNESFPAECYCEATQVKFREWLKAKYGTLEALGTAWHRYSFADWKNIHPPRGGVGYPDSLDWAAFRRDNALRLLKWRVELIRKIDPKNQITAHGTGLLNEIAWRAPAEVQSYGYTWVASRHTNEPWMQFNAADTVRGGVRGKTFWHSEATGGPLWLQPQVVGRPLEDGRSSDEKDVRVWSLIDMTAGARGILFTRWRPLLDGPLFGAFGPMGMDGSVTPRAEMAGTLAKWANAHPDLWKSRPVKGDVGIVFVAESLDFATIQGTGGGRNAGGEGGNGYTQSAQGAYQAFFDSNIQADFVALDDLAEYPLIYLPYPEMLTKASADKLKAYVAQGGILVSEGCPGYFGDGGRVGAVQPNLGLDELFGAKETYVQFTPDLLTKLSLMVKGQKVGGQFFLQEYQLAGGSEAGRYANGKLAAVEHTYGKGRTLLIGTFPGGAYARSHEPATRDFFASLLPWAGVHQQVESSEREIKARLHRGDGGTYLWVVNPTRTARSVTVTLPEGSAFTSAEDVWQTSAVPTVAGTKITTTVEDRNAAVIRLK